MNNNSLVQTIIGATRIKYTILEDMFREYKKTIRKADSANLYIDCHYIFHRMYNERFVADLHAIDGDLFVKDCVISFLNMLGHYRRYISTRFGKDNMIFITYSQSIPIFQKSCYDEYGEKYYNRFNLSDKDYGSITKLVNKAIDYIKTLLPYFEGIYFIDGDRIEDITKIGYLLSHEKTKNSFNIIYTRNETAYQLINETTLILYPKRDDSILVNTTNGYDVILGKSKYRSNFFIPKTVPLYHVLHGYKDRDVDSFFSKGPVAAVKILNKMNDDKLFSEDGMSIQSFIKVVGKYAGCDAHELDITSIYRAVNVSLSVAALSAGDQETIVSQFYDKYDQEGLEDLNEALADNDDMLDIGNLNMNYGTVMK